MNTPYFFTMAILLVAFLYIHLAALICMVTTDGWEDRPKRTRMIAVVGWTVFMIVSYFGFGVFVYTSMPN